MLGLSSNLTLTVFVYLCIFVFAFVYLGVRRLGTLFLRSLYHLLFKNIAHHGSFQGFSCYKSYKRVGLDGLGSLCGVI